MQKSFMRVTRHDTRAPEGIDHVADVMAVRVLFRNALCDLYGA